MIPTDAIDVEFEVVSEVRRPLPPFAEALHRAVRLQRRMELGAAGFLLAIPLFFGWLVLG